MFFVSEIRWLRLFGWFVPIRIRSCFADKQFFHVNDGGGVCVCARCNYLFPLLSKFLLLKQPLFFTAMYTHRYYIHIVGLMICFENVGGLSFFAPSKTSKIYLSIFVFYILGNENALQTIHFHSLALVFFVGTMVRW